MNTKTITFRPSETVTERQDKITNELMMVMAIEVIDVTEARLHRNGYPDTDFGHHDDDLKFADSITVTYAVAARKSFVN